MYFKITKIIKKLAVAGFIFSQVAVGPGIHASEIDSFTGRYKQFEDLDNVNPSPVEVLDEVTNIKLNRAIEAANIPGKEGCSVQALHDSIRKLLSGPKFLDVEAVYGIMEGVVDMGKAQESPYPILRKETAKKDSVYGDFSFLEAPMIYTHISTTFPVNHPQFGKILIGSDKLGHFFGQGYSYHIRANDKGLKDALDWGERAEKGHMGWTTTGIYSNGDLVANYQGMKFWDQLLDEVDGKGPYVLCKKGKWVRNSRMKFSWMDYLDPGMDEGINCNVYRDSILTDKVLLRQLEMEDKENNPERPYVCPTRPDQCTALVEFYRKENEKPYIKEKGLDLVKHMVSEECQQAANGESSNRPTKESILNKQCEQQAGFVQRSLGSCQRICSHVGSLTSYFARGLWDHYWDSDSTGVIQNYQKSILEVQRGLEIPIE